MNRTRDVERGPDVMAVTTALWRASHLRLDAPPHVLEDEIGLRLVRDTDTLAAFLGPGATGGPDAWLGHPFMGEKFRRWRASMVARARLADIVEEQVDRGGDQYVILGAGLDSFALRRVDLVRHLRVFEVDEPATQAWKRRRLNELGFAQPPTLFFVPVDFERQTWVAEIVNTGFDWLRPAVGVLDRCHAVPQCRRYSGDAGRRRRARPRVSVCVCSFVLPGHLIEPDEQEMRAETEARAAASGHPWLSSLPPEAICRLAEGAGFADVRLVTADDLAGRYFVGRVDGLRPSSQNAYLIASSRS